MRLRVGEGERAAPAPAEHQPALDAEVLAQPLDVGHEVPGRVLAQLGVRRALAAAALVEEHDAPARGIEVAAVVGLDAAARAAVQEDGLPARGVADLLVVERVERRDLEEAALERLDRRIEIAHAGPPCGRRPKRD